MSWPYYDGLQSEEWIWSWLARLARGNGIATASLIRHIWPETRIYAATESVMPDRVVSMLDECTAASGAAIRAASTSCLLAELGLDRKRVDNPKLWPEWISSRGPRARYQICIDCLQRGASLTNVADYGKQQWRFGMFACCEIHGRPLMDLCPECATPVRLLDDWDRLLVCPGCARPYGTIYGREIPFASALTRVAQLRLAQVYTDRCAEIPGIGTVSASDYFDVVWGMMRILHGEGGISSGLLNEVVQSILQERYGSDAQLAFEDSLPGWNESSLIRGRSIPTRLTSCSRRAALTIAAVPLVDAWPTRYSAIRGNLDYYPMRIFRILPLWAKNALLSAGWSHEFLFSSRNANA